MNNTILIVEDEEDILDLIDFTLSSVGYDTIACQDTINVKNILDEEDVSIILMDRNLPGIEGSVFIQSIRDEGYNHPVIYISAKDKSEDILEGFNRGADDYITKPFNLEELKARVNALIKRTTKQIDIIKCKDITYISSKKQFYIDDKEINLTHLEHDLLLEFIKNQDILLTRDMLLDSVWGTECEKQTRTVNVAMRRLREKIDPNCEKNYFKSIRGEGYMFLKDNK